MTNMRRNNLTEKTKKGGEKEERENQKGEEGAKKEDE